MTTKDTRSRPSVLRSALVGTAIGGAIGGGSAGAAGLWWLGLVIAAAGGVAGALLAISRAGSARAMGTLVGAGIGSAFGGGIAGATGQWWWAVVIVLVAAGLGAAAARTR